MTYRDFDFEEEGRDDMIRREIEAQADYDPVDYPEDYWLYSDADPQPKDD